MFTSNPPYYAVRLPKFDQWLHITLPKKKGGKVKVYWTFDWPSRTPFPTRKKAKEFRDWAYKNAPVDHGKGVIVRVQRHILAQAPKGFDPWKPVREQFVLQFKNCQLSGQVASSADTVSFLLDKMTCGYPGTPEPIEIQVCFGGGTILAGIHLKFSGEVLHVASPAKVSPENIDIVANNLIDFADRLLSSVATV